MEGLTQRQERLVQEFLIDLNKTQAAVRAGYSRHSASAIAHETLEKPEVQAAISEAMAERSERTKITQDMVLQELAKIGFANMADYMTVGTNGDPYLDFSKLTRDQAAALQEVTVEDFTDGRGEDARDVRKVRFKLADKRAALVDIGRHLGMFPTKVTLQDPDGKPLGSAMMDKLEVARRAYFLLMHPEEAVRPRLDS